MPVMISVDKDEYERLKTLEATVTKVVTQRGDDICWRDIYTELAKLVGIDFSPELICDKEKMLANCSKFVDSLYDGGTYTPVYVEVNKSLRSSNG